MFRDPMWAFWFASGVSVGVMVCGLAVWAALWFQQRAKEPTPLTGPLPKIGPAQPQVAMPIVRRRVQGRHRGEGDLR